MQSLSQANISDLESFLKCIGYNKIRSQQLKEISNYILNKYNNGLPSTLEELKSIPYVGSYTAGAILCFVYNVRAPMVDSNVVRIISRLFMRSLQKKPSIRKIEETVEQLIPKKRFKKFNLSLLDLGATVCIPRKPNCPICPLQSVCDYALSFDI
jgi:A/G-specific adenine glycosylase